MCKRALITGITGQDGQHLTQFLLGKDYEVFGFLFDIEKTRNSQFALRFPNVKLIQGDLANSTSIIDAINLSQPDEIYNLGAITFVGDSFKIPEDTANITGLGTLRILETIRNSEYRENVKFYQASSSEMFGKVLETPQTENTPFNPQSPYAIAKTFAHYSSVNYRDSYGIHASSGILFNHEGEFRGHEFVTRKITSNVAKIKLKKQLKFSLGKLSPKRDWGYAGDYVEAMWLMTQQDRADTFVISTGISHSVEQFVETALEVAGLEKNVSRYVDFDQEMIRPSEVEALVGDSSKAEKILGWKPKTDFKRLVEIMVENDLKIEASKN
jgi:GDPmannose 4,6-dehydratase